MVLQWKGGASLQHNVEIEGFRLHRHWAGFAVGAAENQVCAGAGVGDQRHGVFFVVLEIRLHFFFVRWQGKPRLDAEQFVLAGTGFVAGSFRVGDAFACRHPVHLARVDHLVGADAVAVLKLALIKVSDGAQPDMRMRAHIDAALVDELGRSHLVEEDERTDHLAVGGRQSATHIVGATDHPAG